LEPVEEGEDENDEDEEVDEDEGIDDEDKYDLDEIDKEIEEGGVEDNEILSVTKTIGGLEDSNSDTEDNVNAIRQHLHKKSSKKAEKKQGKTYEQETCTCQICHLI
jgi:hypothetical protein